MTQVATLEAAEAIRGRLERALLQEVNLASENGRGHAEELIEETLRSYEAEALSGQRLRSTLGSAPECCRAPQRVDRARRDRRADARRSGRARVDDQRPQAPLPRHRGADRARPRPRLRRRPPGARLRRAPARTGGGKAARPHHPACRGSPSGRLPADGGDPAVSSNGHTICTIRRFRLAAGTLDDLVGLGFLSEQAAAFLAACVRAGKNIVISGRVSSGKTTLLNALGRAVPGAERVVVCESSAEPAPCHPSQLRRVRGQAGERRRPRCGVARGPRLRRAAHEPDRILVGECRGPETMAMLWSFATGHAGMTSVHGESASTLSKPRPLRPHRRRSDRGRAGARLGPRRRSRRALRSPTQLHGQRTALPARRIDEVVEVTGVEGRRLHPQPALRRRRLRAALARKAAPPTSTSSSRAGFHVG